MVYYNHAFYRYLTQAARVIIQRESVRVYTTKSSEPEDVPYATLNERDSRALLVFIGDRIARFMEMFGGTDG